jgi:hypothetical protein
VTLESNGLSSDLLRIGAEQAAAGATLGLSVEETFNLQQHLRERGIKQVKADDYAPDPFGEAPEPVFKAPYRDGRLADVAEVRRPQDDFRPADFNGANVLVRGEKVDAGALPDEFLNDAEIARGREGRERGKLKPELLDPNKRINVNPGAGAPGRGVADALAQLRMGQEQFGTAAFPGMDRAIERLEEDNQPGKVGLRNERKLAAQAVAADARPFNSAEIDQIVAAELNNRFGGDEFVRADGKRVNKAAAARIAAERGIERQLGQFDVPINELAAAEAEIRAGLAGRGGQNALMQAVHEHAAIRRAERQGRFGDQRGQRILDNMGEIKALNHRMEPAEVVNPNAPTTSQELNAPPQGPLPRGQRWMVDHLPDFGKAGGDFFADQQVGILEEGKLFADRLRGMGVNVPRAEVRNIDELQQAADFVVRHAAAKGEKLGRFDREAGQMVFTDNPGIQEVLYKLHYSDPEIQRLANAMNQVEVQKIAGANPTRAEMFAERVPGGIGKGVQLIDDAPKMRPDGGVPLALIKNEKIGKGDERIGVRAALAELGPEDVVRELDAAGRLYTQNAAGEKIMLPEAANAIAGAEAARNDAQMAIQGGIKGEVPRANFIKGDVRQMGRPERVRRFGKKNADAAGKVEANFLAGEEARRRRAAGQQIVEIRPKRRGGGTEFPEVSRTDAGEGFRNVAVPSPKQPIQPARVAPSMAPDPWAGTGPARMETAVQQPQKGPQLALPPGRSARPITSEMKQLLNQLTPERVVNNPPGNEYRFSPDYQSPKNRINREIGKRIEKQNLRRRVGGGAAAAAGVAGLAALIGGERDQREQEQYQ